mmetsp:Transcript_21235/g.60928  ORF Transcript_21235/g.60928 Transcript_21235/m.60928 type:complete len:346 (-) Transcript_21235:2117-3154(-)
MLPISHVDEMKTDSSKGCRPTCRVPPIRQKWYHATFFFSATSLFICLLQILLPPPFGLRQSSAEVAEQPFSDGCADGLESCVCPRETVCADTTVSIVLLALARCSAFFDYPLYMMLFLSKAHNINDALRRTPIREVVDFADMHHVHRLFGIVVGVETMSHSFFHLLRWGLRDDDIHFLWQSRTGISGLIACLMTPLIVWPMVLPWLKKKMSFEWRKGLHFLSWVWALVLLYHAPSRIYLLIGIPSLIYFIDRLFGFFFRTHLCDTVEFERYGEGGVVIESCFLGCPGFSGTPSRSSLIPPRPIIQPYVLELPAIGPSASTTRSLLHLSNLHISMAHSSLNSPTWQ